MRKQYIGKVNHAIFDSTGKKIVVSTEENVLALLHAGTGMFCISIMHRNHKKRKHLNILL